MDPLLLFGTMVFWIIIASIIGGVILLRPVSKRLGHFLDEWIAIRKAEPSRLGSVACSSTRSSCRS